MIKSLYHRLIPERNRNNARIFMHRLVYPFYLGNKFHCNCCSKDFRKFISKGNIKRLNARCPYCLSLERVRLLELYLDNELDIYNTKGIKLLHIAPEETLFKKLARLDIEYIDADINPAYARHVIDITDIKYKDNYFDLIICSHVLGHVPNEEMAIRELNRVLKTDGIALIMTLINPNSKKTIEVPDADSPGDRLKYYGEPDLCRLHGADFNERLMKQGFVVERIDYRDELPTETLLKNSLGNGDREIIYSCKK